ALDTEGRARSAASDVRLITVVCVGHFLSHFYGLVLPPLFPLLRTELGVSYAALGVLITASAGASAISQPVSGFLVDRFGARRILLWGSRSSRAPSRWQVSRRRTGSSWSSWPQRASVTACSTLPI